MWQPNNLGYTLAVLATYLTVNGCGSPTTSPAQDAGLTDMSLSDLHADTKEVMDTLVVPAPLPKIVFDINAKPAKSLNATNLMRWNGQDFQYNEEVIPYDLNTPLFSDYAVKARAIYIPAGTSATYHDNEVLNFPVGTIILKSFYYPEDLRVPEQNKRLLETRVLVHSDSGWKAWPYLWNEDGSDATLHVGGAVLEIELVDYEGVARQANYLVPQRNQCSKCHKLKDDDGIGRIVPIGPKARHLHRDYPYPSGTANQLTMLSSLGKLSDLPPLDTMTASFDATGFDQLTMSALDDATVNKAARDYLDINCAHCHNPKAANGETSQLFLNYDNEDPFHLGVCKLPGSAGKGGFGRTYNIVPGSPDDSILMYRTETEITGAMMPDLGRSLRHNTGADLVYEWILRMPPVGCDDAPSD